MTGLQLAVTAGAKTAGAKNVVRKEGYIEAVINLEMGSIKHRLFKAE